ncbi:hypothetical protein BaRGS_00002287 [Batillaria attramentaria]|uniref:Uncharacterized protein n=1 Tax=Batillaria attramentaria TaxID=370345 RepID=A0ABD0M3W7_9CAEN
MLVVVMARMVGELPMLRIGRCAEKQSGMTPKSTKHQARPAAITAQHKPPEKKNKQQTTSVPDCSGFSTPASGALSAVRLGVGGKRPPLGAGPGPSRTTDTGDSALARVLRTRHSSQISSL